MNATIQRLVYPHHWRKEMLFIVGLIKATVSYPFSVPSSSFGRNSSPSSSLAYEKLKLHAKCGPKQELGTKLLAKLNEACLAAGYELDIWSQSRLAEDRNDEGQAPADERDGGGHHRHRPQPVRAGAQQGVPAGVKQGGQ